MQKQKKKGGRERPVLARAERDPVVASSKGGVDLVD